MGKAPKPCTDHLGNPFPGIGAMCRYYDIPRSTYRRRIQAGWDVETALTEPANSQAVGPCTDHEGTRFPSQAAMLERWGTDRNVFRTRQEKGWTLQECLTGKKNAVQDHKGTPYEDTAAMCAAYGISPSLFRTRMKAGYGLETALTTPPYRLPKNEPVQPATDHEGIGYPSFGAMCEAYGRSPAIVRQALNRGHSLKDALLGLREKATDPAGNVHKNATAMVRDWHASLESYDYHVKNGLGQQDALAKACAQTWPGSMADGWRIQECVQFPWFMAEMPDGHPVMAHASFLKSLLDRDGTTMRERKAGRRAVRIDPGDGLSRRRKEGANHETAGTA